MQIAYTATQVRAAERPLLDAGLGGALMRRAAAGLASACRRLLIAHRRAVTGARVVVLAGKGNNGGDALYAAANLAARGAQVTIVPVLGTVHPAGLAAARSAGALLYSAPETPALTGNRASTAALTDADSTESATAPWEALARGPLARADLVIDGILGTGATGEPTGPIADLITAWLKTWDDPAHRCGPLPLIVAVDVPTGVDASTGRRATVHVPADLTVTFGAQKAGLVLAGLPTEVIDIGLDLSRVPESRTIAEVEDADLAGLLPYPGPADHKYSRGVLGVLAGSPEYPGAGRLATGAAVACGLGMVRVFGAKKLRRAIIDTVPEAVPGELDAPGRCRAFLTGPGAPDEVQVAQLLSTAIEANAPLVLDAGALLQVPALLGAGAALPAGSILTPHVGEFRTLYTGLARAGLLEPSPVPEAAADQDRNSAPGGAEGPGTDHTPTGPDLDDPEQRLAALRGVAAAVGAVVLLKGHQTLIATPAGAVYAPTPGPANLATAGSGDVLAGILGALLATGAHRGNQTSALLAAAGVLLHNRIGTRPAAGPTPTHARAFIERIATCLPPNPTRPAPTIPSHLSRTR